jgi:hypothetical protein
LLSAEAPSPSAWATYGKTLFYVSGDPLGIWTLTLPESGGLGQASPLLVDKAVAYQEPALSPDGRWLAYTSGRSGQAQQVFVQSYPRAGRPILVAREGGSLSRWSPDGRELFYLAPNGSIIAVDVRTTSEVVVGPPRVLLASAGIFDVDRSGRRFLVSRSTAGQLHAVANWMTELRQTVLPRE